MPEPSRTDLNSAPPPSQYLTNGNLVHHTLSPPEPRLPSNVFLQRPSRKHSRPSTAPPIEDVVMLPCGSSGQARGEGSKDVAVPTDRCNYSLSSNGTAGFENGVPKRDEEELVLIAPSGLNLGT